MMSSAMSPKTGNDGRKEEALAVMPQATNSQFGVNRHDPRCLGGTAAMCRRHCKYADGRDRQPWAGGTAVIRCLLIGLKMFDAREEIARAKSQGYSCSLEFDVSGCAVPD